ncbi:MAG: hypothetical protein ACJAQ4_002335 [Cryomorphaceae bacterium]|jgi:hypothetical protein
MGSKRFYLGNFGIIGLVLIGMAAFADVGNGNVLERDKVNINFVNIDDAVIRNTFIEVFAEYDKLHEYDMTLIQEELKNSTMQAQPIIGIANLFTGKKRYKVQLAKSVCDAEELLIEEVPRVVLKGWFAHELGHIVDYEIRSNVSMIGYGLKYTFSDSFKKACEHQADSIAIEHGFHKEIIATKKFLLQNELISEAYKEKLRKYYMPISGVKMCLKENVPVKLDVGL